MGNQRTTDDNGKPRVPDGWSRERWIQRLRYLADSARSQSDYHVAETMERWATALENETDEPQQ